MKAVLKVNQIMLLEMSKNKSQPAYKNSLQNFVAMSWNLLACSIFRWKMCHLIRVLKGGANNTQIVGWGSTKEQSKSLIGF